MAIHTFLLAALAPTTMRERTRKDIHREFTTLRFRPLSEHGE